MSTTVAPPSPARAGPRRRVLPDWWGWVVVGLIALVALATWLPAIGLPLGDSNEGRILARLGIQARNFWEMGPAESDWATNLQPFHFTDNYAHHPPLANVVQVVVAGTLGAEEWHLRLFGYLSGLATLVLTPVLLRTLKVGWGPTLLATGALAATPFFWMYGRVGGGFGLLVGFAALVAHLRERERPSPWAIWGGAALAAATVMLSWVAAAGAGLLWIWLWRKRGLDRATLVVAAGGLGAALLTAVWILSATDLSELGGHVVERGTTGGFGPGAFLARQLRHARHLLPVWFLVLAVPALIAGLADRRTRVVVAITLGTSLLWTVLLNEGAFTHDYWNLNWLLPITVGLAALLDWVARRLPSPWAPAAGAAAAIVVVATFWATVTGPIEDIELMDGVAGGVLVERNQPLRPGRVLYFGPGGPRWISWYWDRPARPLDTENLAAAAPRTLVLLRLDRLPDWIPGEVAERALDTEGRYVLVTAKALRDAIAQAGS